MSSDSKRLETILILDTEGLDKPTEIGAILFNFERGIEEEFWSIVPFDHDKMNAMIHKCDAIVSHSAGHDKNLLMQLENLEIESKPWICTMYDFAWPSQEGIRRPKLRNLCKEYKISVKHAHNALRDCHMLQQCILRIPNFQIELERALITTKERMKKLQRVNITLLTSETKLVKYSNEPILTKFLWSFGRLYHYNHGKYCEPTEIIPLPEKICIYIRPRNMINAKKLQNYINNGYPISVGRFQKKAKGVMFTIGEKHHEDFESVLSKQKKKEYKVFNLVDSDKKPVEFQNEPTEASFMLLRANLNRCRKIDTYDYTSWKTIECPKTLKINMSITNIENCRELRNFISQRYPVLVSKLYERTPYKRHGILFTVGKRPNHPEASLKEIRNPLKRKRPEEKSVERDSNLGSNQCETKISNLKVVNQTELPDCVFLKFLSEQKEVLELLQKGILAFAPIILSGRTFYLHYNAQTIMLEIKRPE
jgi:hypothetical protein